MCIFWCTFGFFLEISLRSAVVLLKGSFALEMSKIGFQSAHLSFFKKQGLTSRSWFQTHKKRRILCREKTITQNHYETLKEKMENTNDEFMDDTNRKFSQIH